MAGVTVGGFGIGNTLLLADPYRCSSNPCSRGDMVFLGALGSGHAWIFNGVLAASLHPKPFESRAGTFCYLGFTIFGILWGMFAGIRNHDDQPGLINAVLIPTATSAIFLSAAHLIKGLWTRKGWSPTSLAIGTATVGFSLGCLWLLRLAGDREKAPTG